jgi:hypothetical protein
MSWKQGGRGRPNQREEDGALVGRRNRGGSDQPGEWGSTERADEYEGSDQQGEEGTRGAAMDASEPGPRRSRTPSGAGALRGPEPWRAGALGGGALGSREPGRPERRGKASPGNLELGEA